MKPRKKRPPNIPELTRWFFHWQRGMKSKVKLQWEPLAEHLAALDEETLGELLQEIDETTKMLQDMKQQLLDTPITIKLTYPRIYQQRQRKVPRRRRKLKLVT